MSPGTAPAISFVVMPSARQDTSFIDSVRPSDERIEVIVAPADEPTADSLSSSVQRARGEFVVFVTASDRLLPGAVTAMCDFISPEIDLFYTNELSNGSPLLKPVFSPERLRCQFYPGRAAAYRRSAIIESGLRNLPGAELYDLFLRMSRNAEAVAILDEVAFDLSDEPAVGTDHVTRESVLTALTEHLSATGGGTVEIGPRGIDSRRPVMGDPLVSIVIPTRGDSAVVRGEHRVLVVEAVRSVIARSTWRNLEFVVVVDESTPDTVIDELRSLGGSRMRLVSWHGPFSFSGKVNLGGVNARGEYLLFLNDDVEVISAGWIEAMLALAQLPGAGIAGAMLYFEDDTIQHAGHAYYRSDVTHIGLNSERGARGPLDGFLVEREVDGVTAACALMPKSVFFEVGGFTTLLPGNFNDVDLCMKVAAKGYRAYWTPHAELYHFESKSRNPRVAAYEIERAWGRWEHLFWESKYWPDDPHILYRAGN